MELKWFKVHKNHIGSTAYPEPKENGVYVASVRLPYTDDQGSLEYIADHGTVLLPRLCYHGQARNQVILDARALL